MGVWSLGYESNYLLFGLRFGRFYGIVLLV